VRSRVFKSLADPEVTALFTDFSFTAFRINTREEYLIDEETSAYETFKATGKVSSTQLAFMHDWVHTTVDPAVKAGKRMDRVQIWRTDGTWTDGKPGGLSDYHRFQNEAFKISSAGGEKIRIITTTPDYWPEDICLPTIPRDFWLFDSSTLLELHFNKDNTFREAVIQNEYTYPSAIIWANRARDAAMVQSAPFYP
jgi:hypothetical protein